MKYLFITLIGLFGMMSSFAQSGKKNQTITIKTNIYCDHCNQCGSCGKKIYDAIYDANPGIKKIKVLPEKNAIEVSYNSKKTNPDQIRTAISKSGFDADDLPADAIAYEQLDGCCKK